MSAELDEKDADLADEQGDDKVVGVVTQALTKYNGVPPDLISYVSSICAELAEGEHSISDWTASLRALSPFLPDQEALVRVCQQIITALAPAEGSKTDAKKDGANLVVVDPLTLGFMGKILLLRTSMRLEKGRRYGLVGENGAGKSTLMKKISNHELPGFDSSIQTMFCQADFDDAADHMTPETYLKATTQQDALNLKELGQEIEKVLNELMFTPVLRATPLGELSGGWRMRVSLARARLVKTDLLLLDEPTNHLDASAVEWLMAWLQSITMTAIIISHDPNFLDAVCTDVMMIKKKKLVSYRGNFTAFTRAQRDFTAEDLERMNERGVEDALHFRFPDPGRPIGINSTTRSVLSLKGVTFAYSGKMGPILKNVTCRVTLSSRVAVIGPNGAGKSTLVKLMVGELKESEGCVWKHHNLITAYVAQHSFDHLEKVKAKPVMQYIKQRFCRGYDNESAAYKPSSENETFVTSTDVRADKKVEEILGRRKYKNALAYEVKWVGRDESENTWEDLQTLRKMGAAKLVEQCDERLKAKKSGLDQRPLTNLEITRHLMDFGLDKQYALSKIENLSGGQKCKLVLAAALWTKPHVLILDEPTNYLDLEALAALAKAIQKFKGGLVMVSHNKEFMAEICNEKWSLEKGVLTQELGMEKPEKLSAAKRNPDLPLPRRAREASRANSTHLSGTEDNLAAILGPDGLQSALESDRLEAAKDLLLLVDNNALSKEELILIVTACCQILFASQSPEIWDLGVQICNSIAKKFPSHTTDLLSLLDPFLTAAPSVAPASKNTDANENTIASGSQFQVGETVQALWTDKKFYKATIVKLVSQDPVKYQVHYPDFSKTATVPEKGGLKKAAATRQKNAAAEAKQEEKKADTPSRQLAGVLAALGALGGNLEDKAKVMPIVQRLVDVLTAGVCQSNDPLLDKTVSCVARPLAKLAWAQPVDDLIAVCLQKAVSAPTQAARTGSASAATYLAQDRIATLVPKFYAMLEAKDVNQNIGGLLLFTRCFIELGEMFEWHMGQFLPRLLAAFGSRETSLVAFAKLCCRDIMKSVTSHGAKLMIPELLGGLGKSNWKLRVDCIQVLGSMAFCSPAMMASSLPRVVPRLLTVMTEPRKEVSEAAHAALTQIASVITNPEILPLVPALQNALKDSFHGTKPALEQLAATSFAHAIDPASLALIMPISIKGMTDSKPETKRTALKVVAALCALILDIRDIQPYTKRLLKNLKQLIFHNTPEIRVEAAKALGVLVNEVGNPEKHFPGLEEWLAGVMLSKESSIAMMDGACQATAHLLLGKHIDVLKARLPKILETTKHQFTNVRTGFLNMLVVLNEVFGDAFGDLFLGSVLPVTLEGLCDPMLPVQEAALEASQEFVSRNTNSQLSLILPMLEVGLSHHDYKVRTNYLQLMGTVLLNLVTTANFSMSIRFYGDGNTLKEGELANVASKEQEEEIVEAMGIDKRNALFSLLYVMRHDSVDSVGSMAWRVWHLVVPNEKDLLNVILPTLLDQCLNNLKDNNRDQRETGRKTLGALVQCTGLEGLHRIIPTLQSRLDVTGLEAEDATSQRKACCLGFSEVLRSAEKSFIGVFLNEIIFIIRDMLCDANAQVRNSASHAFRQLYKNVGSKAVEKIAPHLIDTMKSNKVLDMKIGEALVDGIILMLSILSKPTFFFLCRTCLDTLKAFKNPANDTLRVELVKQLHPVLLDTADANTIQAAHILARYCMESPDLAEPHLPLFAGNLLKRDKAYMREPAKRALYTTIYYAFRFNGDVAKAREKLIVFMQKPPPGFTQGPDGLLTHEGQIELAEMVSSFKPDALSEPEEKMPEVDEAEPEAPSETSEGVTLHVGSNDEKVSATSAEDEQPPAVSASDKWCPKCKTVKPKSKFSVKMAKKPDGTCKVCS